MNIDLSTIVTHVQGEIVGDPAVTVSGICSLEEPHSDYLSLTKETHPRMLKDTFTDMKVKALLISNKIDRELLTPDKNFILVADPLVALVKIIPLFFPTVLPSKTISPKSEVHPTARIGKEVTIGAFCSVGEGSIIEDDVTIFPHVTIYPDVWIGKGATIHSGAIIREGCRIGQGSIIQNSAVIGADGFGYVSETYPTGGRSILKVPQVGIVDIAPHVEIGANTCIDRATLGTTKIGAHTKIDNLVQIGHNTKIGMGAIICGQVGIAGSVKIGNGVVMGGGVGIADHLSVVDGARFASRSGITTNITEKGDYGGFPAVRAFSWRRQLKAIADLPKISDDLAELIKTTKEKS